jgi:hypothetical protein
MRLRWSGCNLRMRARVCDSDIVLSGDDGRCLGAFYPASLTHALHTSERGDSPDHSGV